jgi:FAD/FMN-containing dehydrogenase
MLMEMPAKQPMLSGWGRLAKPGKEVFSEDLRALSENAVLSRGLGRSYGDSALPPPSHLEVATTTLADRILAFDASTGVLRAEAGLSLRELNRIFLPRGWFPPVTPGTQFVTLGGMVAADVHGKNHHVAGTIGAHLRSLVVRVADGRIVDCSPSREPELFWASVGGMGLTGHILEVELAMQAIPSPWIYEERIRCRDVDALVAALKDSGKAWPFTVGWLDCLGSGRGILNRGRWAERDEAPSHPPAAQRHTAVPFELPNWVLNRWSMRAFNAFTYVTRGGAEGIIHPETFFYPLDKVLHWNRIYGRRGFIQYQCVLTRPGAASSFLALVRERRAAVFLCVIKDCAAEGRGMLSFPMPGISIALDLAVDDDTQALVDHLNEAVLADGGRVYLAKDAFTRAEHFRAMEPRLEQWTAVRRRWDPKLRIRSAQSVRVLGDPS